MNTIFKSVLIGISLGILTWIIKDWLKQSEEIADLKEQNSWLDFLYDDLKNSLNNTESKKPESNE